MIYVYDIECLPNYFLACFLKEEDGSRIKFEISDYKDDSKELYKFLLSGIQLIAYNCLKYDAQLLEYIIKNRGRVTPKNLHEKSNAIIESEFPEYPEWKLSIPHLDLLKIWHFDNKAKMTSLKWIQFSINWHNVEDMPIKHDHIVKDNERELIESYCWNDVESTLEFYKITLGQTELPLYKGKNKIALRENINHQFKVNSYNWNDVKIGDSINKIVYKRNAGIDYVSKKGTIRETLSIEECISDIVSFETQFMKDFLIKVKKTVFNPRNVKEHPGWKFSLGNLRVSFGFGGIHSIDKPRYIESNDEYYICDNDVAFIK